MLFFILFDGILSMYLDEVFTYNHIALISLRSRSHFNTSMVLITADHLCIHNYIYIYKILIRLLLNIILRPILMFRTELEHVTRVPRPTVYVSDALANSATQAV